MKVLIVLALAAVARAGVVAPAVLEDGTSSQHRSEDYAGNYNFGYDERHTSGGSFRQETGDAYGNKVGSYGLHDADGRVRTVNYVADAAGFRASIATNEPGTAPSSPAAAGYNAPVIAPAPAAVAAPVAGVVAAPLAAPVTYAAPLAAVRAYSVAAPAVHAVAAAPVAHYAAPAVVGRPVVRTVAAAPVVSHVAAAGPALFSAPAAVAAPVSYGSHVYGTAAYGAPFAHAYAAPHAHSYAAPYAHAAPFAASHFYGGAVAAAPAVYGGHYNALVTKYH